VLRRLAQEVAERGKERGRLEAEMWAKAEKHLEEHKRTREAHEEEVCVCVSILMYYSMHRILS
jgi:single-stranded DNA-specific DHH superfamily exonuclease